MSGAADFLKTPLLIGGTEIPGRLFLAPMAGVCDIGFRTLAKEYGADFTYTEMISAKGLNYKNRQTEKLLARAAAEKPMAVQLFGSEPEAMAEAARNPLLGGFEIIDINMGCPVNKVAGAGEGSALMKDSQNAENIIRALVKTGKPVTVKFRAGWDDKNINCVEFAKMCEGAGAAAVCLHPRTRTMYYSGKADYGLTEKVVKVVRIPVIHSGDIFEKADLLRAIKTGAAAFMVGRGALGRPYVFRTLKGGEPENDVYALICRHVQMLAPYMPEAILAPYMRTHIAHYVKGLPGAARIREKINHIDTVPETLAELKEFFA